MRLSRGFHVFAAAEIQTTEEKEEEKTLVKNNMLPGKDMHSIAKSGALLVRRPNMLPPTLDFVV